MRHVTCGDVFARRGTVDLLIVEKYVSAKGMQKIALTQATKK